jgi:dipeptidyl aminopeptidase/acylaminoacyl peptidase
MPAWLLPIHLQAHLPIWVFHGAKDAVVPVKASEDMVNALKNYGSDVRLKIYPEANHDSWTETYNNEGLYKWLLEQSLDKK